MIITFAGHGKMTVTEEIKKLIKSNIRENMCGENVTFYCGGYGAFDNMCAHVVKELKSEFSNITSVFVTPYLDDTRLKAVSDSRLYDEIIYPDLEKIPRRFAIIKRNEFMVNSADLIIAYVCNDWGGAHKTLVFAEKKKKRIINLADYNKTD